MEHLTPKKRILVVDDNQALANATARLLQAFGQDTLAVYDGQSALVNIDSFKPDMIFLDIAMPEMDGCQVATRIRANPELQHITLIAITGYDQPEHVSRIECSGFDCHVVKPVKTDMFKRLIMNDFVRLQK